MKNKLRKNLFVFAVAVTVLLNPSAAMAHGHGHGGGGHHNQNVSDVNYTPCNQSGCNHTGEHRHGTRYYEGHSGACDIQPMYGAVVQENGNPWSQWDLLLRSFQWQKSVQPVYGIRLQ